MGVRIAVEYALMDDETPTDEEPRPEGVFGNLPRARPGKRSPRRGAGSERTARPAAEPPPDPPTAARAAAQADAEPPDPASGDEPRDRGLEDLAWAGVAAAAEAATLGIRLANRALGAVRKPPERP
jgi:hypothetical protein